VDSDAKEDEVQAATRLAQAIAQAPIPSKQLLIKIHPRETADKYQSLRASFAEWVRIVPAEMHRWEVCVAADDLFGIDSMLLEEARIMGCAVHRLQSDVPISLERSSIEPLQQVESEEPASRRIVQILNHEFCSEMPASAGTV
jgi:hypothetical protein